MNVFRSSGDNLTREILGFYGDGISYSAVMKLLRNKDVKVNGKRVGKDMKTRDGDEICVYYSGEKRKIAIKEIYRDDNLLVAYKPKGVTSEKFFDE